MIIISTNIICGIVTVKLNNNITGNLPIELVCEIVSFMYKFQHQLKFQPVLQYIKDRIMCVLQTLTLPMLQYDMNPIDDDYQRLERWASRIHPPSNEFERYEGASQYVTPFGIIRSSK